MTRPAVEPGQSWAIRDASVTIGCRYVTVIEVDAEGARALVKANYPPCDGMDIPLRAFESSNLTYCGYRGPGRHPPFLQSDRSLLALEAPLLPSVVLITSDGKHVCWLDDTGVPSLGEFEAKVVAGDPHRDWRVEFVSPAPNCLFQRHGEDWVLIWRGCERQT